jgi:TPR repeat protein
VKQRITTFVASGVLALALFGEAMAGPLEGGEAAYQRGDYETAVRLWRLSGDEGNVDAQFNLGLLYSSGGQGLPQDYAEALIWFRKAADQGDARAQVYLGGMYRVGRGVRQDYAQAVAWFRKAANQGNLFAQADLGEMYRDGQGAPQDLVRAYMWFSLVASSASDASIRDQAVRDRNELAAKMTPAQIAEAQRLASGWASKK